MSKHTLSQEIQKELEKLNDTIDRKIIKGQSFAHEARRHKELLATLDRMQDESRTKVRLATRLRRVKSPVRRRLAGGPVRRLFGLAFG